MLLGELIKVSVPCTTVLAEGSDMPIGRLSELVKMSYAGQKKALKDLKVKRVAKAYHIPANSVVFHYVEGRFFALYMPKSRTIVQNYRYITCSEQLDPMFLAWFLTRQKNGNWFQKYECGSVFLRLDKQALLTMPIGVVPKEKQLKIVEALDAIRQKGEVEARIARIREEMLDTQFSKDNSSK